MHFESKIIYGCNNLPSKVKYNIIKNVPDLQLLIFIALLWFYFCFILWQYFSPAKNCCMPEGDASPHPSGSATAF